MNQKKLHLPENLKRKEKKNSNHTVGFCSVPSSDDIIVLMKMFQERNTGISK